MEIFMFLMFFISDIFVVLICKFSYNDIDKYEQGMIIGVHIPKQEINNPDVKMICDKVKNKLKIFWRVSLLSGILICFIMFLNIALFMIIFLAWIAAFIICLNHYIVGSHKEMYALKVKNNWINESTKQIVHIDTSVSTAAEKLAYSFWYHLPAIAVSIIMGVLVLKKTDVSRPIGQTLAVISIITALAFAALHILITSRQNVVYSTNSDINFKINKAVKYNWSVGLLAGGYTNMFSCCYLAIKLIKNDYFNTADFVIYTILQILVITVIVMALLNMRDKKNELLKNASEEIVIDDDEFWKDGGYNNPNDKRIFVPNRLCSTNYAINMAHKVSKVMTVGTYILIIGTAILVISSMIPLINVNVKANIYEDKIRFYAGGYNCDIAVEDIEYIELIEELPKENFVKINGAATNDYSIGRFNGKDLGKCELYILRDYKPILKVVTKNKVIFVNSKSKEELNSWYEFLTSKSK